MSLYYPIMLNIKGKSCTVVGGGLVAERKVKALLEHGAIVKVISPQLTEGLKSLVKKGKLQYEKKPYETGDLTGSCLVYAVTDDKSINKKCKEEAEAKQILINIGDAPDSSDFILPAAVKRGSLTIAISTEGKSPALSRRIKEQIEDTYTEDYGEILDTLGEIREKALEEIASIEDRKKLFHQLVQEFFYKAPIEIETKLLKEAMWEMYRRYCTKPNDKKGVMR
ncbi:precorrin-2 dehydrogenase / sirohydrochlorin ferrochelatase [Natronincola peptidivorans]|uniref:precorrin-2 dehydrogenase n=1 Tax=Natronincola peptidivorans TaxID=426128 RepID=A0A1I0CYJ9_9FIRM|nr:bifunctional precorrin-2 dehydrogenase/sirohydrochlorin ferrochelatase [Natronincola peptidivorans]SET24411.1 precorrin-2 dehydrogenase / sirohydrochlorin ferrochelatase [Natronincola peptidivorans]